MILDSCLQGIYSLNSPKKMVNLLKVSPEYYLGNASYKEISNNLLNKILTEVYVAN